MNPTARKYVDLFRAVKVASAATVYAQGRPQSRIINVMLALDEGMVIVTSRGKPFWKQLTESGRVALSAMCPECQSLKFTGSVRRMEDSRAWVDEVFLHNKRFAYGGTEMELVGFSILETCTGCGACASVCPQQCIMPGTPYQIAQMHCLQCGLCTEHCPAEAIVRLHA